MENKLEKLFYAISIIALGLGIWNLYQENFIQSSLHFRDLPNEWELIDENSIEFSFYLYNSGPETAFVEYIMLGFEGETLQKFNDFSVEPLENFMIQADDQEEISVVIRKGNDDKIANFAIIIRYNDMWTQSKMMNIDWSRPNWYGNQCE